MLKKVITLLLVLTILINSIPVYAVTERTARILFTHDIHSYLDQAPKLASALDEERNSFGEDNCIYLDSGDFSQGTLYQAGYETRAYELGLLSLLGCSASTIGNHEWDHAGIGFANMLEAAVQRYNSLPPLLCANLDFNGELNEEQRIVSETLRRYNQKAGSLGCDYTLIQTQNGIVFGVFGLSGEESIEDSPTSGMKWLNYVDAAKTIVKEMSGKCDVIIALSHSGTDGDGVTGEDIELAKAVPEIDMILSGHSHTAYPDPIWIGTTLIASAGCYLTNLGSVDVTVDETGEVSFSNYSLIPLNETVEESGKVKDFLHACNEDISENYLKPYGLKADQILATLDYDFMSLDDMYETHEEYPMGNLIADSYIYEANKNGYCDIDVALVGLGTIRDSFSAGNIDVSDAFEVCSLGVGMDGSAGHPILSAYITGKELKLLVELDASLGPLVSAIKMSYSGLRYEFNTKRMILDRAYNIRLHDEFTGAEREIEDDRLYRVCCNMYAANMLGMLNGLTKGILKIEPKYEDGTPVLDFYDCEMLLENGAEMKEWVAFADYLTSFESGKEDKPSIPDRYARQEGRKVKVSEGGLKVLRHPGTITWVIMILCVLLMFAVGKIAAKVFRKTKKTSSSFQKP